MTEWKPIETAPRDGESFLGIHVSSNGSWTCWVAYCAWEEDGEPVWFNGDVRVTLTHWQPLPPPPVGE